MNMYIPIIIVVLSNTVYNICAKSTPQNLNPFASLSITYIEEYGRLHWSSFVLGIAIVGLEAGFLLMYRVGWNVSTGQVISSIALSVVLIFVGALLYKEVITISKVIGIIVCMIGLYLINK